MHELRAAILAGAFPPGGRLIESDIAEQMGVSRAPVREAIRALQQEGLVEIFPHRGAVVVGVSEEELERIYELRALIEQIAFARACETIQPEQLEELAGLIEAMRRQVADAAIDDLIESDIAFHRLIVRASGYRIFARLWESLDGLTRVRTLQSLTFPAGEEFFLARSAETHAALYEAVKAGDAELARQLVGEHILAVADRVRELRAA